MKSTKINGRIISASFKCCSYYGNPSYYVTFENLETHEILKGYTASNAACGYGIENDKYKKSATIEYHQTRSGNIIMDYCY